MRWSDMPSQHENYGAFETLSHLQSTVTTLAELGRACLRVRTMSSAPHAVQFPHHDPLVVPSVPCCMSEDLRRQTVGRTAPWS